MKLCYTFCIFAMTLSGCQSAQPERSTTTNMILENDPAIHYGQLPNGFRYALMQNNYPEERVVTALNFDVGSAMEEDSEQGIAHFLEHMAFRRSKHFPDSDIVERMQKLGIAFGHNLNAYTSFYNTCYELDLPNNHSDTIETALSAFRDWCDGLIFNDTDVDQERGVILSERRDFNNVQQRIFEAYLPFILDGMRINHRLPIGQQSVIEKCTAKDIQSFHDYWYSPDRMFFVAVGNIDVKQMEEKIIKTFSDIDTNSHDNPDFGTLKIEPLKCFYFSDPDLTTTDIEVSSIFPDRYPEHTLEAQRHITIMQWLTETFQQRLQDYKITHPELFIKTESDITKNSFKTNHFIFSSAISCEFPNWRQCLTLIENELRKLKTYGITEEELSRCKKKSHNRALNNQKAASTRVSNIITNQLISCHNNKMSALSPEQLLELTEQFISEITLKDCNEASKEIFQNFAISIETNKTIDDAEKTITEAWRSAEKTQITKNEEKPLPDFAYKYDLNPAAPIASRKHIDDLDITQICLQNGVKINLKKTDWRKNQVSICLRIGQSYANSTFPLSPVDCIYIHSALISGGLEKCSWQNLRKIVSTKQIELSTGFEDESFTFNGQSSTQELTFLLNLIRAYIDEPAIEEQAWILTQKRMQLIFNDRDKTPSDIYDDAYEKFIFGDNSFFGLPDHAKFFERQRIDTKSALMQFLHNAPLELTIVGDFPLEETIQSVQKIFGSLSDRDPLKDNQRVAINFPSDQQRTFTFTGDEQRAVVIFTYPTIDKFNTKECQVLQYLAGIISDRIRDQIRKLDGKAYSPRVKSNNTFFDRHGKLEILLSLAPEEIDTVHDKVLQIIEDIKKTPIDADELERIRKPILNHLRDNFKKNEFWSNNLAYTQRFPQFLDDIRNIEDINKKITPQDILSSANQYLNHPAYVVIRRR